MAGRQDKRLQLHKPRFRNSPREGEGMTLPRSARFLTMLAILTTVSLVCLAGAQSASAKTYACGVPDYPDTKLGGYFTSLSASGFSSKSSACKAGKSLVLAYYKCRRAKGIKGRCTSKVNGYSCSESRPADSQSAEQLNAKVTCRTGSKKIVHTYQQNLT
jgi:hypothetical protein